MSRSIILQTIFNKITVFPLNNHLSSIRHGHHLRGKPPGVSRSLAQRLAELNQEDPELSYKVDIGLPAGTTSKSAQLKERLKVLKSLRSNPTLEKLSRTKQLLIDLEKSRHNWLQTNGPMQIKAFAEHYGVYQHLFGDAYFIPRLHFDVTYNTTDGEVPVYYGNIIKPSLATKKPMVNYESDDSSLWTLLMTNPDGHLTEQNSEYVHWFVGNIPGNKIDQGETIIEYLQPFPPRGTGYHRHIFILYKQEKRMDYSKLKKDGPCLQLSERTFSTLDFYRVRQDELTPATLAFFQADWDKSLVDFYHNVLEMVSPHFEYDFAPPYVRPQEWFPLRQAFNLYMDRYRDPKQINKEFLLRKLKNVHPFKPPKPVLPFPMAQYWKGYVPSWLKLEIKKSRLKWGRINDIENKST